MYARFFGDKQFSGSQTASGVSIILALLLSMSLVLPSFTSAEGEESSTTPPAESPPPPPEPTPPPPSENTPPAVTPEGTPDASGTTNAVTPPPPADSSLNPTDAQSNGASGDTTTPGDGGEPGSNAPSGGGGDIPPAPPAVIATGDAVAVSDTENVLNTNTLDTTPPSDGSASATTTSSGSGLDSGSASGTPPWNPWNDHHAPGPLPLQSLTASTTNGATSTNAVANDADTGANGASGNYETIIDSGDAASAANLVNLLNVNLIDSNGFLLLLNRFFGGFGNLDLRPYAESNDVAASACGGGCIGGLSALETTLSNTNVATIANNVVVRSRTGENSVEGGGDGGAYISTGDAYAAANVVNVANTNIVHSNYMVVMLNSFGDWNGDLVFPNDEYFARFFAQSVPTGRGPVSLSNTNGATASTSLEVAAETGLNEATENGSSAIETGNSEARGNVVNRLNRNEFGGGSVLLVLRFFGDWLGDVFNAPQGLSWSETNGGLQLWSNDPVFTPESGAVSNAASGGMGGFGSLSLENTNRADITNNVKVLALTGENRISSTTGDTLIQTGNAYAAANILNMANTNIIGKNWILAIVNIFGRWSGNVSFGQPDLWIGAEAVSGSEFTAGSPVTYRLTIANHGDAPASGVTLRGSVDRTGILNFSDQNGSVSGAPPEVGLGVVPAGESRTVEIQARVDEGIPVGDTPVTSTMRVTARETDANIADNSDTITIRARRTVRIDGAVGDGSGASVVLSPDPVLHVTKQNFASTTLTASSTVDYAITITNDGGSAYHSVLIDTLKDQRGRVVNEEEWQLGEIKPNEEIRITYTSIFSASTTPGTYTNYAIVRSISRHPSLNPFYGSFSDSNIATSSVVIVGDTTGTGSGGVGGSTGAIDPPVVEFTMETSEPPFLMPDIEAIAAAFRESVSRMAREIERVPAPQELPGLYPVGDLPDGGSGDVGGDGGSVVFDPQDHTASVFAAFPWARDRRFSLIFLLAAAILISAERMQPRLWRRGFTGLF